MFLILRLSQVMEVEAEISTSSRFPTMRKSHDDSTTEAIKAPTSRIVLSSIEAENFDAARQNIGEVFPPICTVPQTVMLVLNT